MIRSQPLAMLEHARNGIGELVVLRRTLQRRLWRRRGWHSDDPMLARCRGAPCVTSLAFRACDQPATREPRTPAKSRAGCMQRCPSLAVEWANGGGLPYATHCRVPTRFRHCHAARPLRACPEGPGSEPGAGAGDRCFENAGVGSGNGRRHRCHGRSKLQEPGRHADARHAPGRGAERAATRCDVAAAGGETGARSAAGNSRTRLSLIRYRVINREY